MEHCLLNCVEVSPLQCRKFLRLPQKCYFKEQTQCKQFVLIGIFINRRLNFTFFNLDLLIGLVIIYPTLNIGGPGVTGPTALTYYFSYNYSFVFMNLFTIKLDSLHPKRIFAREVIEKCMRFSYYKKLLEFLPREFTPLMPHEPLINYVLDDGMQFL